MSRTRMRRWSESTITEDLHPFNATEWRGPFFTCEKLVTDQPHPRVLTLPSLWSWDLYSGQFLDLVHEIMSHFSLCAQVRERELENTLGFIGDIDALLFAQVVYALTDQRVQHAKRVCTVNYQ